MSVHSSKHFPGIEMVFSSRLSKHWGSHLRVGWTLGINAPNSLKRMDHGLLTSAVLVSSGVSVSASGKVAVARRNRRVNGMLLVVN